MTDQRRYTTVDETESYLSADDADGDVTGAESDDTIVVVKHKQEGVRFEATVDGDGYLRGEHGRYLPVDFYAIAAPSPHRS